MGELSVQGPGIGSVGAEEEILLEPEPSFAVVQQMASRQGATAPVSAWMLWKRMAARGLQKRSEHEHLTQKRDEKSDREIQGVCAGSRFRPASST
jgi:hypothetical protein